MGEKAISDIRFLASLADERGYFRIQKRKARAEKGEINPTYKLVFVLECSNKRLLEWVQRMFGGAIHTIERRKKYIKDFSPLPKTYPFEEKEYVSTFESHRWEVSQRIGIHFLKEIHPYLRYKKQQAKCLIDFYEICIQNEPHKPLSKSMVKLREECYLEMKELHKTREQQNENR